MVTVCTVLPPTERPRVDAVGDGCFATLHADSFRDVLRAARTRRVDALVISVHRCPGGAAHPRAAGAGAGGRAGRRAHLLRGAGAARPCPHHRPSPRSPSADAAQHAHVTLLPRGATLAQELPGRDALAARRPSAPEPRPLRVGRGLPALLLFAPELL